MNKAKRWLAIGTVMIAGVTYWGARDADDEHRAIAWGMMVDRPAGASSIDRGIEIAEQLRLRYGIDTGDVVADRMEAARRAREEVVAKVEMDEAALRQAAFELGYDPDACADYCASLRRLAEVELRKRALVAYAEGR